MSLLASGQLLAHSVAHVDGARKHLLELLHVLRFTGWEGCLSVGPRRCVARLGLVRHDEFSHLI